MQKSVNKLLLSVARDSLLVAFCTIAAKAVTLGKDIFLAGTFGIGFDLDIFLIALVIPLFISSVINTLVQSLSIPEFVRSEENKNDTYRLFSSWLIFFSFAAFLLSLICGFLGDLLLPFIASGFEPEKLLKTQNIYFPVCSILWLRTASTVSSSFLQSKKRFVEAAISQAALPGVMISFLLLFADQYSTTNLIAFAAIAGYAAEALVLLAAVCFHFGKLKAPQWGEFAERGRKLLPQAGALIVGASALASTLMIDQAMASSLAEGSISALGFGLRVSEILVFLTAGAVSTSVFPYFSDLVESGDLASLGELLKKIVLAVLGLSLLPTILFCLFSEELVSLVYQRGAFSEVDTLLVAKVQAMYVLQVPFYTASLVYIRLFSALRKNEILMFSTLITVLANVSLNYLLMQLIGVSGIALSTTLVSILNLLVLSFSFRRLLKESKHSA